MNEGVHCYCQKPLTYSVYEARRMAEVAAEKKLVTQMGTETQSSVKQLRVKELVQSGALGQVTEVHVWTDRPIWLQGAERPKAEDPVPANLDWDLWLGPAESRPYAEGRYHPAQWRRWWAFGTGTLGDMACHYMDLPYWALKLRHPTSCEAEGPDVHAETCPLGLVVRYEYPEREGLPPLKLTWYDGDRIPKEVAGQRVPGSGVMFVGSEGKMFADYTTYRLFPTDKYASYQPPAQTIPPSIGHHAEWIKACKDGSPTTCNFDYSGALTEAVLLGTVAYRTGKKLQWDAKTLKATNCPEADALINKVYRAGWEVV